MGVLTLLVLLLMTRTGGAAEEPSILIFRPLGNSATEVETPTLPLQVEVSAFSPIKKVTINGQTQAIQPNTYLALTTPVHLQPGENRIVVDATTEFETARKEYIIILKVPQAVPPPPARKALEIITVAGVQNQANVLKAPEGQAKTAGTRSFLVLIPRYDWAVAERSTVRLQAIVSRDKYGDDKLKSEEAAFTQGTSTWLQKFGESSQWNAGAGYDSVYLEYGSLGQGKVHFEDDTLVFGGVRQEFGGGLAYEAGLELKQQNFAEDAPDRNYEGDANVATVKLNLEAGFWGLLGKLKEQYRRTDSIGKYLDNASNQLSLEITWPVGDLVLTGLLRGKQTTYAVADPLLGKALDTTLNTFTLNATYKVTSWWLISVEGLTEQQTANVAPDRYKNSGWTVQTIFIY